MSFAAERKNFRHNIENVRSYTWRGYRSPPTQLHIQRRLVSSGYLLQTEIRGASLSRRQCHQRTEILTPTKTLGPGSRNGSPKLFKKEHNAIILPKLELLFLLESHWTYSRRSRGRRSVPIMSWMRTTPVSSIWADRIDGVRVALELMMVDVVIIRVFYFCKAGPTIILRAAATLLIPKVLPGPGRKESYPMIL